MAIYGTIYEGYKKSEPKLKVIKPPKPKKHKMDKPADVCGVYIIVNELLKKAYIGQSVSTGKRIGDHIRCLNSGQYITEYYDFQVDYNKHKFNFESKILCECNKPDLLRMETFWLKKYVGMGYSVYNRLTETHNVVGTFLPQSIKPIIDRLIHALDRGFITEQDVDKFLKSKRNG